MIFFFDLDGTLRQTKSGLTFINEPDDQQPIPGAQKAVAYYASKGFTCIGITNQGGVAAGYKSLDNAIKEQQVTLKLFPQIKKIYMCPDDGQKCICVHANTYTDIAHPQLRGKFRKPSTGMIQIPFEGCQPPPDSSLCWMVGDRVEDFECAKSAQINFIWADIMLSKFRPGIHEHPIANISAETLMKFLSL
ncbi:MAG: hypothetical protein RLZZ338_1414 [Cyanobacteriota bacterium]|jgi:D-glycero-D-manno-heptose 1,7-bisphosphate phosphatase